VRTCRSAIAHPEASIAACLTIGDILSPAWPGVILVAANPQRVLPS